MGAAVNAGHPDLVDGKALPAIAIPAARTPTAQEQRLETMYASRGDEMLAIKDISAARKFYEYAANAGSVRAATALAESYDPAFLTQLGAVGIRPDPTLAAAWSAKAVALGDAEARLRTQSAK
jgi:TPR repeat protein